MTSVRANATGRMPFARSSTLVAVAIFALLSGSPLVPAAAAAAGGGGTVLISSAGTINKSAPTLPCPSSGVIAVITSPGTTDPYFGTPLGSDTVSALSAGAGAVVVTAQGATLDGNSAMDGKLSTGGGAAAASSVAGSVILSGVTVGDVEAGLGDTRHGRTLSSVFTTRLERHAAASAEGGAAATLLVVAVQADEAGQEVDVESVEKHVRDIFDEAAVSVGVAAGLEGFYEVAVVTVGSEEDASKVMSMATAAASRSPLTSSKANVSTAVADVYAHITGSGSACDPPLVTEVLLGCDDAYARHYRSARARLAAWKSRAARGLSVPDFGKVASALLGRTTELYDRDTMVAAGLGSAAPYRLEMRAKLAGRVEKPIREIFDVQVANLQKLTLRRFEARLLRKVGSSSSDLTGNFYEDNAEALHSATLAFESAMDDLEVPALSLTKSKAVQDMAGKLNSALAGFPDTPAARIKELDKVKAAASREKKPTERSVDVGLDLVGMIRPDGFGSFQGFAGYQLGGNQIIVGVHNDADSPEVIGQFGGVRPPFIRVQPKLKLDIEL